MTNDNIKNEVLRLLGEIAPEAEPSQLKSNLSFRDQLDIDSMDFLNFMIAIEKRFGVAVPETDYAKLATLDGCVAYLAAAGGIALKAMNVED